MNLRTILLIATILLAPVASGAGPLSRTDPAWDTWETPPLAPGGRVQPPIYKEETVGPLPTIGLGAIRAYQVLVSPLLRTGCRFSPSCSRYAFHAIASFGLVNGTAMGTDRISRCHPFAVLYGYPETADGLLDDPPETSPVPVPILAWLGF